MRGAGGIADSFRRATTGAAARARALSPRGRAAVIALAATTVGLGTAVVVSGGDDPSSIATVSPSTAAPAPITVDRPDDTVDEPPTTTRRSPATTERDPLGTGTATTIDPAATTTTTAAPPPVDADPQVVARPVPDAVPAVPPPPAPPPPWAASTRTTPAGLVSTDVGCSWGRSAAALDGFFSDRVGPAIGWDYQHVYPLGGDRYLWLFQDTFLDHGGSATRLDQAGFAHNVAMVQQGNCFTLLHRGSPSRPQPFEPGTGGATLSKWWWPMGGELVNGQLLVFWVEMVKDRYDPRPPDGLGWHPARTWLAVYDPGSLRRLAFVPAPNPGVTPVYGYAVASDATHTYLFGNTFEQNLAREGGYWNGPHSATVMWLARVPRGALTSPPEYRTADGWSPDPAAAVPIMQRFWAENPMQPRFIDGRWVAATKVDGYWGEELVIDVANDPWGPWTTVQRTRLRPRGNDPAKNTYHAHLTPWRDPSGALVVTVSNNARDMLRDAYPRPDRYRPMAVTAVWAAPPPRPPETTTTVPTTVPETTTTTIPSSSTTTVSPTTTSTTVATTTTTAPPGSTPTTVAPTTAPGATTTTAGGGAPDP